MRLLAAIVCVLLIPAPVAGQENDDLRESDSPHNLFVKSPPRRRGQVKRKRNSSPHFAGLSRDFPAADDDGPRDSCGRGDMHAALARWDGAIRSYRAALTRIGDSAEGHVALGTMYLDRGLMSDAVDQFRRATAHLSEMGRGVTAARPRIRGPGQTRRCRACAGGGCPRQGRQRRDRLRQSAARRHERSRGGDLASASRFPGSARSQSCVHQLHKLRRLHS